MQRPEREAVADEGKGGRILLVDDRESSYDRMASTLATEHDVDVETDPAEALFRAAEGNYDLMIVSMALENFDALRLCSQARSLDRTRNVALLAIVSGEDNARLLRGLEIGVNDYLVRPVDKNELLARARTQICRKRYTEHLRDNMQLSIEMAITDALTGPHNRRYMESHIGALAEQAQTRGKPLALMMIDIDYFKAINDNYGHDPGDDVLREFATRIRKVRSRHRSRLPLWRRGVRRRHAGDRYGGGVDGGGAIAPGHCRRDVLNRSRHASDRSDDFHRSCHPGRQERGRCRIAQARRSGALSGQARRPQPRGSCGGP